MAKQTIRRKLNPVVAFSLTRYLKIDIYCLLILFFSARDYSTQQTKAFKTTEKTFFQQEKP